MSKETIDPRIAAYVSVKTDDLLEDEKKFGKGKRIGRIKIEAGTKRNLRLLKAPTETKFYVVRKQHWNVPYGMGKVPPQTCSWAHAQESCYHCSQTNEYFNSGDPRFVSIGRKIKASTSYISNVLDLDDPLNDDGTPKVQVWQYSQTVFRDLKGYFQDPEYGDLAHPLTGRDIRVTAEITGEQGGNTWTKYAIKLRAKETPLDNLDALDSLYVLADEYPIRVHDYKTQEGIFNGSLDPRSGNPRAIASGPGDPGKLSGGIDEGFESAKAPTQIEETESDTSPKTIDERAKDLGIGTTGPTDVVTDDDDGWGDEDDGALAEDSTEEVDSKDDSAVSDIKKKLQAAINKKK